MPLSDIVYAHPSDNVAALGVITSTGVSGSTPIANVRDLDPATVVTFTGGAHWWLKWDFTGVSAYAPIKWLVLVGLRWPWVSGRKIQFEAHTSDNFSTPDIGLLTDLPVNPSTLHPMNVAIDLTGLTAYNATHDWIRVTFVDPSGGAPPTLGEVLLCKARRTLNNVEPGVEYGVMYPHVSHLTPAGRRLMYSHEVRQRWMEGRQMWSSAELTALDALYEDARGAVKAFPIQRVASEEPWFVTFDRELSHSRFAVGTRRRATVRFVEVVDDRVA